jgi:phosphoglycolate phosphatase-like HAD superfamily hydrolase
LIKNVIFDWSGVVSNDIVPVHKALLIVFEKLGVKKISLEEFRQEFELPYMKFYAKYAPKATEEELSRLFTKAIHSVEEPEMFPGTKDVLKFLHSKNIRMAVLSTHMKTKLDKEVINYGLSKFFISVKGSIVDKTDALTDLMKQCKFISKETAYVGDMAHDIEVGKKAGVTTIASSWGYYSKERIAKCKPDFLIDDISELKKIMTKVN